MGQALWQAKRIGAHRYLECSALTGEGMEGVFGDVGREAAKRSIIREQEATRDIQSSVSERPKKRMKLKSFRGRNEGGCVPDTYPASELGSARWM